MGALPRALSGVQLHLDWEPPEHILGEGQIHIRSLELEEGSRGHPSLSRPRDLG